MKIKIIQAAIRYFGTSVAIPADANVAVSRYHASFGATETNGVNRNSPHPTQNVKTAIGRTYE